LFSEKRIVRIAVGFLLLGLTAQTELQEPFGLPTFAVEDQLLQATWEDLREKIHADRAIISQCRVQREDCLSPVALRFIAIVAEGEPHQGLARIGHINRAVNFSIRGNKKAPPGEWTSPLAALTEGSGDCKQHAILKYVALRDAGFSAEAVRVVIVGDRLLHQQHALVAVHEAGRWLFLDNHSSILVEASQLSKRYTPLNVLDQAGVRTFARPSYQVQKSSSSEGG
jgi:predicted transglutaminase-like cysteine proteinase